MSDDDVIGVCTDCKSDQPEAYLERSKFAQEGLPIPCRYCGGLVILTYKHARERALNQERRDRGLN